MPLSDETAEAVLVELVLEFDIGVEKSDDRSEVDQVAFVDQFIADGFGLDGTSNCLGGDAAKLGCFGNR
jgi:hypothetical protein